MDGTGSKMLGDSMANGFAVFGEAAGHGLRGHD